jgi:hypothetical protein
MIEDHEYQTVSRLYSKDDFFEKVRKIPIAEFFVCVALTLSGCVTPEVNHLLKKWPGISTCRNLSSKIIYAGFKTFTNYLYHFKVANYWLPE